MQMNDQLPDLVIIDGDLGAKDGIHCNGPALADTILRTVPQVPIIAWSDCDRCVNPLLKYFTNIISPLINIICGLKSLMKTVSLKPLLITLAILWSAKAGFYSCAVKSGARA